MKGWPTAIRIERRLWASSPQRILAHLLAVRRNPVLAWTLLVLIGAFVFCNTAQAQQNILPLDVSTVTTGGTAVTAIASGHRTAGGKIQNPPSATQPLCINEIGTASGTTSAGNTTCIQPGFTYKVSPATGAVSVISSDSAHAFSGEAYQPPPLNTTTVYIVGNGAGVITPRTTATMTVQVWGAGQSGNDSTGAGGKGGSWAQGTIAATVGTPIPFSLGAPGIGSHGTVANGGDTWFSSSSTLLAPGGGSSTAVIGTLSFSGGAGGVYATGSTPGGGGAAGPFGNGNVGGSPTTAACGSGRGGGGGGGNGGGTAGAPCTSNSSNGGAGGNGEAGTGGAGGVSAVGSPGGKGAGGGGGAGDAATFAYGGGQGGDDYDNGGGGGGGSGSLSSSLTTATAGANGGTPGGGGSDCVSNNGTACTVGSGGWGLIKITYPSSADADQIYVLGSITGVQIPAGWTQAAKTEAWGAGAIGAAGTGSQGGGGGGGGAYSEVNALPVAAGSLLTGITVAQGTGVTTAITGIVSLTGKSVSAGSGLPGSGTTGGSGGSPNFQGDSFYTGGSGTFSNTNQGGGGGGGAGSSGGAGNNGSVGSSTTGGAGGSALSGGAGGTGVANASGNPGISDSRGAGGGAGGGVGTTVNGGLGGFPGGGGGGGGTGTTANGGAGTPGMIVLTRLGQFSGGGSSLTGLLMLLGVGQ